MLHHARFLASPGRRRGFTIVEIVMACIIIGILTLALVPVLTSQANNARLTSCKSDLENLSNAQERAAVDTGYMFRPYALNDVSMGDGIANAPDDTIWPYTSTTPANQIDKINGIRDNAILTGNLYTQNPSYIFISPTLQDFLSVGQQQNLFRRLTGSANGDIGTPQNPLYLDQEKKFGWNGPYIHWKRDVNNNDWPDDPWGNDYLFFTKNGILFPPERDPSQQSGGGNPGGGSTSQNSQDRSDAFQQLGPFYDNIGGQAQHQFPATDQSTGLPIFDRPTWLSLGPDGIPGSLPKSGPNKGILDTADPTVYGYGKGDDIFYSFGGN